MKTTALKHSSLDDWIARESIPFAIDSPETLHAAVDLVANSLGNSVELLGFGEALHGGEEILVLRNRLFQRLVEAHEFTAIAFESSFPRARLVNDYITGRGPVSYEDVKETGFSHGFGRLDANRELVEWMREYNADPAHHTKIHFYGFDLPGGEGGPASPREVLDVVLDYLIGINRGSGIRHRERIDSLLGQDSDWQNPMLWRDPVKSVDLLPSATALRVEVEDVLSELHVRRPELVECSGADRYREAVQYALVARQFLRFFVVLAQDPGYSGSLGVRDALMADNLEYVVSSEQGRGRVLVFAHNAHLQRGLVDVQIGAEKCTWWPAGAHLSEVLGSRYAVIGTALGVSDANGIGSPEPGSLEARFTAVRGPARFIPTHRGEGLPEGIGALSGRSGSSRNPTYVPLARQSLSDFDWLAVLDSTTYTRGGRQL